MADVCACGAGDVSLHAQLACAQRELAVRHAVYPARVARGEMTRPQARRELAAMHAIVVTLGLLCAEETAREAEHSDG